MGRIFDIKNFSVNDGPGIRTTFFLKGCSLHCKWCHNPEGQNYNNNFIADQKLCLKECFSCEKACVKQIKKEQIIHGEFLNNSEFCSECNLCSNSCLTGAIKTYGREAEACDILKIVEEQKELYTTSSGGVTFSGGEPFYQFKFLLLLCKAVKNEYPYIHIALETSLDTEWNKIFEISEYVDLFIVDFKCLYQELSNAYVGLDVDRFRDNFKKLSELKNDIWIRMVAIKDITFNNKNIRIFENFITSAELKNMKKIQFLEYHSMAFSKYDELNIEKTKFECALKSDIDKVIRDLNDALHKEDIIIEFLTI